MLELRGVSAGYGTGPVVWDLDLSVRRGEIVTLIGANGAGKSTLVKTVSGLLPPMSGQVIMDGQRIDTMSTGARVRLGVAHVPEGRQVFAGLTVADNLRLGAYARRRTEDRAAVESRIAAVCERFPVLGARMDEVVGNFSGGQQQMLAIARGLMSNPSLLILDEPSLGLSPLLVQEVFGLIAGLRAQGISILLSEQNARSALTISDRGYVIESGRVVMSGQAADLLRSPEVADRYLGTGSVSAAPPGYQSMAKSIRGLVGA